MAKLDSSIEIGDSKALNRISIAYHLPLRQSEELMKNPLLQEFKGPFETVPFEEIETKHFLPALEAAIEEGLEDIQRICAEPLLASFENTIVALENAGVRVSRVAEIFFNLNSAETNEEIQKLARNFSPLLSNYRNDVILNEGLFHKVEQVYSQKEKLSLAPEDLMLLEKTYRSFARNGAQLKGKQKDRLRQLDQELAQLSLSFGEHVLAETNNYELFLEESELEGLPDYAKEAAADEANAKGKPGMYYFGLQAPSFIPFMTYSSNRARRRELYLAFGSKAFKGDDQDNKEVIQKLVSLRKERAELLGYKSHADFTLAERMAESPEKVWSFLAEIEEIAYPAAQKELKELKQFAAEIDRIEDFQAWDLMYYKEKLKQEKFAIDDNMLKPYFELDKVIDGAFQVAEKLYGIQFKERWDLQKYHPEVITYEVLESDGSHLAVFYADFFPRAGKRNGAWMTSYRSQKIKDDRDQRPHISIVCNFTKPGKDSPSLLTFNEVLTLFHEFGHALHGILAKGKYASLSGTNVYWDFVELPSQILENWCYEKECLDLFAVHYKNGTEIPEDYIQKLKASSTFMEGYATLRQLSFAKLDMAWHHQATGTEDVASFEEELFSKTALFPSTPETNMSCSFSHIFQGGYSAGYYSYKWAEVLDADAFELFKEKGIFDQETASKFRDLLASGGALHPVELYRNFRGQDPDPKALLRRAGLIKG